MDAAVSILLCGVGGLLWGTLAGLTPARRGRTPVWRSSLLAAAGAAAFEGILALKAAAFARARLDGRPGETANAPPPCETLRGLALESSLSLALSAVALGAMVQPNRAPLAFGGWALARLFGLSQGMGFVQVVIEEVPVEE